ncbi:dihydroorotate dehydrogenase family protein [Aciduliprofundum sp. MAR08-339]|uniref:dihydroorotate dehydrogenase n=1 Tax=Aciduliprofundum sp. (strain MAR08-339) TaxID=673860 RepID=UPI0002A49C16|nr:dihydroorotate dehydrogenase family protein [Aciduliprofundum sp. MAR08-339]
MLETSVGTLRFKNPLILASGILDESGDTMLRIAKIGAGGIVTKSVGMEPRKGYENPVVYELPYGLLNAMGLPNPGIENFRDEIAKAKNGGVPIIGSVFGATVEDFVYLGKKMQEYGADALELNLSCPHAKGYGMEVGTDLELVSEIVEELKKNLKIPVWAKLTPNTESIVKIAKAAENADALVLINTVKAMAIDVDAKMPVLKNIFGGLSGPAIKPIGVRAVYEVAAEIEKPIVGVGGITNGRDALEYIMAGASAVEIGTAIYLRGIEVFKSVAREIEDWMRKNGYERIEELVGLAQVR